MKGKHFLKKRKQQGQGMNKTLSKHYAHAVLAYAIWFCDF